MADAYNLYLSTMEKLMVKAGAYGLIVEVDTGSYPFKVRFQYGDPAQVSLFNGRKTGTMIVTVYPDQSTVDLNMYDIDSKDLTQLVKASEKVINALVYAMAAGQIPKVDKK